jgi:hypothetical protein
MFDHLTSWGAVWTAVALLLSIGVGVLSMTPPDANIAKVCLSVAVVVLTAKLAQGLIGPVSLLERIGLVVAVALSVGFWAESWRWIDWRVALRDAQSSKPAEVGNRKRSTAQEPAMSSDKDPKVSIGPDSVVSLNQQGGITARTVNVNARNPAPLTNDQGQIIFDHIPVGIEKPVHVDVGCFIADGDACFVTKQLTTVFKRLDWKVSLAVLPVSADGYLFEWNGDDFPAAIALKNGLIAAGLPVIARAKPEMPAKTISIIVGPKRR